MKQLFVLEVNTQRGFAGFYLYIPNAQIDTSNDAIEVSGDLSSGFTQQITDPNGNTYTVTVSRP